MQDVYAFSHATANIIFLCTLAFIGLLALASLREAYVELDEFENMDKLVRWRLANPTVGVGDSVYARMLVLLCIRSYEQFAPCHGHSYRQRIERISRLYALLDEHTDPPPGRPHKRSKK